MPAGRIGMAGSASAGIKGGATFIMILVAALNGVLYVGRIGAAAKFDSDN